MIIIGIDPGYDRLGIAIIEKPLKGKEILLYSACFQTSSKQDIYTRFGINPTCFAIETLFITKNQKTAMRVAEARGIIIHQAIKAEIPITEYTPLQIKMAVTSDGWSDKERVIKMIPLLVEMKSKITHDDEYDAIAVALTHAACMRS